MLGMQESVDLVKLLAEVSKTSRAAHLRLTTFCVYYGIRIASAIGNQTANTRPRINNSAMSATHRCASPSSDKSVERFCDEQHTHERGWRAFQIVTHNC